VKKYEKEKYFIVNTHFENFFPWLKNILFTIGKKPEKISS